MEYLIIKAVIGNTLKEISETRIVLRDLVKLDKDGDTFKGMLNNIEKMYTDVKESLTNLTENENLYRDIEDKQDLIAKVRFNTNHIKRLETIKTMMDNSLDSYLALFYI